MPVSNVYVAAPWKCGGDANDVADQIAAAGFSISSNWLKRARTNSAGEYYQNPSPDLALWQAEAQHDMEDISQSDVMVVLNCHPSEGKVIEQGLAIANGIPIVLIGKRTNVFQALDSYTIVSTVGEAIECLKQL